MAIKIPQNNWLQYNRSSFLGDLDQTFNCDLTSNEGAISFTRTKVNYDHDTAGEFKFLNPPVAFAEFTGSLWVAASEVWQGDPYAEAGALTEASGSNVPTVTEAYSDMVVFNNNLYVSNGADVRKTTGSLSSWTQLWTTLTDDTPHLMTVYGDRLYITDNYVTVLSANTSDTLASSGTFTIDLGLPSGYSISFLEAGSDRIWIGTTNEDELDSYLYEWDGSTENAETRRYIVPGGIMAGCLFKNVPYFVNTQGRLMTISGTSVIEVDRFPLDKGISGGFSLDNDRSIHPNGMIATEDTILILAALDSNITTPEDNYNNKALAGVWEYSETTGLNHKYSLSDSFRDQTDYDDFGAGQLRGVGAIYKLKSAKTAGKSGRLVMGGNVLKEDGSGNNISNNAMFYDEDVYGTKRAGYFVTSKIKSSQVSDTIKDFILKFSKLNEGKYVVKYRTEETDPTIATVVWTSTTVFTTSTDLSDYAIGDEIEVVWGQGAGTLRHITDISESEGTYTVTLEEAVNNVSSSFTSSVRLDKWKKCGEYSGDLQHSRFPVSADDAWVQFRVYYEGTGKAEVYEAIINNSVSKQV